MDTRTQITEFAYWEADIGDMVTIDLMSKAYLESPKEGKMREAAWPVLYAITQDNRPNSWSQYDCVTEYTRQGSLQMVGIAAEGGNWVGGGYLFSNPKIWDYKV